MKLYSQKQFVYVWSVLVLDNNKMKKKRKKHLKHVWINRNTIQMFATLLTNMHLPNFLKGTLYNGKIKQICVPGLNCYSCPAATGACPVGSFQAVVGSSKFSFSYYITGILIFFGIMFGRFICGFFCPFGWLQDLLHKIPTKKFSTKKLKALLYIKYGILLIAVIALPILITNHAGISSPYFCKYLCPQGILEGGIPLSLAEKSIRAALGALFAWKFAILAIFIILSVLFYRPFCKWICPLGAFYSLFNRFSLLNYKVDENKCISCGKCGKICKMDVDISKNSSHMECIRCGECLKSCPTKAISIYFGTSKNTASNKIGDITNEQKN